MSPLPRTGPYFRACFVYRYIYRLSLTNGGRPYWAAGPNEDVRGSTSVGSDRFGRWTLSRSRNDWRKSELFVRARWSVARTADVGGEVLLRRDFAAASFPVQPVRYDVDSLCS
jgi:hypothetical protein